MRKFAYDLFDDLVLEYKGDMLKSEIDISR